MVEENRQDILMMAIFTVTRKDVLHCARDVGMPPDQVTDDVIELVKERVSRDLSDWRWVFNGMVRDILNGCIKQGGKKVNQCPLGLTCSDSCAWRKVGQCGLAEGVS